MGDIPEPRGRPGQRLRRTTPLSCFLCCNGVLAALAVLGLTAFILVLIARSDIWNLQDKDMVLMANVSNLDAKDMILMDQITALEAKDMTLMNQISDLEAKDMTLMSQISDLETKDMTLMSQISDLEAKDMTLMSQISDLEAKDMVLMSQVNKNNTAVYNRDGIAFQLLDQAQNPVEWNPVFEPSWITQTSPSNFTFLEDGVYTFEATLPTVLGGMAADAREAMNVNFVFCIVPSTSIVSNAFTTTTYFGNLAIDLNVYTSETRVFSAGDFVEFQLNLQVPNTWNTATGANPGLNDIASASISPQSCCATNLIITKVI